MKMTYQVLALKLDPNRRDGGEMEDRPGGGKEGGRKRGRAEEVKQGGKEEARQRGRNRKGKSEEARKGGRRKRALRTNLESRGCNSSDLKTILCQ